MTPKQRAAAALTMQIPDQVPTFELEFQLEREMFGKELIPDNLRPENIHRLSAKERDVRLNELAEDIAFIYGELDYAIIPGPYGIGYINGADIASELRLLFKKVLELTQNRRMLGYHADGTFSVPDGNYMYDFAYQMADDPAGLHERARKYADDAILRNRALAAAGVEVGLLCSDYCYNTGPFLSPEKFGEFIQPYLARIIEEGKKEGLYMIKHTDGNIMPILDQLVDCAPHALHSIDPMAGMDIKEVKALVGHRVCLCGNVHCAAMQTGTDQEVIASAEYCLIHGKPGGGYIFCTSNVPFRGMPPERYQMILDVWKRMREYD
jgi:uroporphyrinogen decarboxylase